MNILRRPLDKLLYQPLRTQARGQQALRDQQIKTRLLQNTVRPEKRRGLGRRGT